MIDKPSCADDVSTLLKGLRLSGRAFAAVLGTSSGVLFRWVDGSSLPSAPIQWALARLAETVATASPEQVERLREMALSLPTEGGGAFMAMLDAAALWRLQRAPLVQVPATASAKLIRMRDRKKPGPARLSESGLGGARRGTSIAAPSHRTRATG